MKAAIAAAVIFCAALIGLGYYFAVHQDTGGPRSVPLDPSYTQRIKDGGWVSGPSTAPVKLVEYGDFQCPGCGAMAPIIDSALQQVGGTVQFTFRDYPLSSIHNKARMAAEAAEAAGMQGKFWQMHDLLYGRQQEWAEQTTFAFKDTLQSYAQLAQLDITQFNRDLNDPATDDQIDKDIKEGDQVPVEATPTLVLNGKRLDPVPTSADQLVALIRSSASSASPQ